MNITLQCHTDHDPIDSSMAFSANWQDETHRYHVWIGLRPDSEGKRPPYPVRINPVIYKNPLEGRNYNTIKKDLDAATNAKIKAEIKRLATEPVLMALYNKHRADIDAFDKLHAEADRLNRIFNAATLYYSATVDELSAVGLI